MGLQLLVGYRELYISGWIVIMDYAEIIGANMDKAIILRQMELFAA
jgi:hypothetical protein